MGSALFTWLHKVSRVPSLGLMKGKHHFHCPVYFKFDEVVAYINRDMGIRCPCFSAGSRMGSRGQQYRSTYQYFLPISFTDNP